ncbi:hypothetical protein [Nocardiopsis kunsanensis]|uniref:ATP-binding protein n=1 Tax=Nocardiopsis kunsanensis TaxID=141693 RepID=A0A918XBJ5_9ACTN|nr:hypothetical protein [Nocardiopsis kunsanensis]GHD25050.1 hypothetical protein GCM10007147_21890 [Nocardiopsis kunsanensis]
MLYTARTLLLTVGTAGFVALGTGVAGADTLENTAPLDELGGVASVLDGALDVDPGEVSADPGLQHQSGSGNGPALDNISTDAPVDTGTDNSTSVGPLELDEQPLQMADGGAGDTVDHVADIAGDTAADLGHIAGARSVPMADGESPISLDTGENADLTGGVAPLLGVDETLPMSDQVQTNEDLVGLDGLPELGEPTVGTETLPMSGIGDLTGTELNTDPVTDMLPVGLG